MSGAKGTARLWIVRCAVALTGVGFVVAGVLRSEHLEVLNKAVKICLECIGIG
ncbi:MAG: thioredoxin [Oscillospiraceae bacterium]|nr:thioredoxin [Oscillospiraceae bacterium]